MATSDPAAATPRAAKGKGRARVAAITHEPAFILHHYDWSESSLILEAFTRHHGRVALVAKGVKRPTSNFRPVLMPLQPLQIGYSGEGEVRTLKGAEWVGGHVMPVGEALFAGYHLNELLMCLLPRDDAQPQLFDRYADTVRLLAQPPLAGVGGDVRQAALRLFELHLLQCLGVLPDLSLETHSQQPLATAGRYLLDPDMGLRGAGVNEAGANGETWLLASRVFNIQLSYSEQIQILLPVSQALKSALRGLIQHHTGRQRLRTRQLMLDIQSL